MIGKKISIDKDDWAFVGEEFLVHNYTTRENSTAVTVTVEDSRGMVSTMVVPSHSITIRES